MRHFLPALLVLGGLAACGGPRPPEVALSTEVPSALDASVLPASDPSSTKGGAAASAEPNPMKCGCSLCEPVVSDDPCGADTDCGPSSPCHADKCVGIAKAKPPGPADRCTMIMMCNTTDANICACLNGRCALVPRKK
jgi:hypothetical protein